MPNIASVLKNEILRLARKEVRSELENLQKASSLYRSEIAALKRRVAMLEKQLSSLDKQSKKKAPEPTADATARVRFSAKGLVKHRQRLGLSAADMGTLLGVSAQTIYNWESGKTRPRPQELAAVASIRGIGKRQAMAQLGASENS